MRELSRKFNLRLDQAAVHGRAWDALFSTAPLGPVAFRLSWVARCSSRHQNHLNKSEESERLS